ncbi:alkaline phosphatase family protein [Terriglobus aquaticus]|uniref:Alkaline phosphatase family protein n=1 Tax=Terriglobus aquaticus TaxID=940139 RepID=A0ABW9KNS2_9BACT|nr:alkaline phosphatase family protein [Terriglobus aquaticus]
MTDGLRWQELFRGADASLLTKENYWDGRDPAPLQQRFLAPTAGERRAKLMPFFWSLFAKEGVVFGDQDAGSTASVTNGFNFSYPGYSETLTGHGDPRIDSNDNKPNPNRTVLEWLNTQPRLHNSVAAFGAWEVISGVVNARRCGFTVNTSYAPLQLSPSTPVLDAINLQKQYAPHVWDDESFDAPTFFTALEYLRVKRPHVLFLSLGETDDWAHGKNYGEYLLSANRVDTYLETLWTTLQAMPQYRDNTAILFTTDHGRGATGDGWTSHGQKLPESKNIFIAVMAPGLPARGVLTQVPAVTQSQIAATMSRFLGQDWNAAEKQAGKPLPLWP